MKKNMRLHNNILKKMLLLLGCLMALWVMVPGTVSAAVRAKQVISSPSSITLYVGDTGKTVNAKAKTTLSYKSSNPSVVGVSSKGVLSPKKAGTVKLTIYAKATSKYDSTKKTITVKVVRRNQTITASSKTLYPNKVPVSLGAKAKTTLSYKSSNPSVVGISSSGYLTPKKPGKAVITIYAKATSKYNSAAKQVTVVVKDYQTISANENTVFRMKGTVRLVTGIHPGNGSKITNYVLVLDTPFRLKYTDDTGSYNLLIKEVTLWKYGVNFSKYVTRHVQVTGKLFPGITVYYLRPFAMEPDKIVEI